MEMLKIYQNTDKIRTKITTRNTRKNMETRHYKQTIYFMLELRYKDNINIANTNKRNPRPRKTTFRQKLNKKIFSIL